MKILLNRDTSTLLRNMINSSIEENAEAIEKLEASLNFTKTKKLKELYNISARLCITTLNDKCGTALPFTASLEEIRSALSEAIVYKKTIEKKLKSLVGSLTREGFKTVTYGLPSIPLLCDDRGLALSFLIITGIKCNAEKKKKHHPLMDDVEKELFALEKELARYIDDKFLVAKENMIPFLKLYDEYMTCYCVKEKLYSETDVCYENKAINLIVMAFYIVLCSTEYLLSDEDIEALLRLYNSYMDSHLVDKFEAISLACDYAFYEFGKNDRRLEQEQNERELIYMYIKDGHVVAPCDLNRFKYLLSICDFSEEKKEKYLLEMKDCLAREEEIRAKKEKEDYKKSFMTDREWKLYNLAKCYKDMTKCVADIDAIIDLYASLKEDDENRELLREELKTSLQEIKRYFAFIEADREYESVSLVYYTTSLESANGEVHIPNILRTMMKNISIPTVWIENELDELLRGETICDRKIRVIDKVPYKILYKGRYFPIFYMMVGKTILILDVGIEEDSHQKVAELARSEEFANFVRRLEEYLAEGNEPKSVGYTDLLKTYLDRKEKIMRLF